MDVLIYKQDAIDALGEEPEVWSENDEYAQGLNNQWHYDVNAIKAVLPVQPEPAIPLQWIEEQIEWLKSLDNAFSTLTAGQISAMVNKWKGEQDE